MKFQICLGWLAVVGGLSVFIGFATSLLIDGSAPEAVIGKMVLSLALFGWGVFHLRRCRRINKLGGIDKKQ